MDRSINGIIFLEENFINGNLLMLWKTEFKCHSLWKCHAMVFIICYISKVLFFPGGSLQIVSWPNSIVLFCSGLTLYYVPETNQAVCTPESFYMDLASAEVWYYCLSLKIQILSFSQAEYSVMSLSQNTADKL